MTELFHIIEDAQVVLSSKGVFHQKKVYRRGDRLYAGWGSGFIRLGGGDATSNPNVSWEGIDLPEGLNVRMDRMKGPVLVPAFEVVKEAA